ncbi:MAG: hypothetical protein U1F67_07605 [Rubrivivax sp.]
MAVTQPGTYIVRVNAYSGASIYNLRIGAPGTAASCAQRTAESAFVPGELVLEPRRAPSNPPPAPPSPAPRQALKLAQQWLRAGGMQMAAGAGAEARELRSDIGAQVAKLPADAVARSDGLSKLADFAAGGATLPARALCARPAPRARWPRADPWPEALETLRYAGRCAPAVRSSTWR